MATLTNNQIKATALLNAHIVDGSDFDEGGYAFMDEMLDCLVANGWTRKEAEGTIGSLLDSQESKLQYWDDVEGKNGIEEKLYWMHS